MSKKLTTAQFEAEFKPQKNHLDDNASFDGAMYETFGLELEYVQSIHASEPKRVWTVIDADGDLIASNGYHFANRLGYIITEICYPDDIEIEVYDEDQPYSLPYGIEVGNGHISSELAQQFGFEDGTMDARGVASANALESFILAMANEGIEVNTPSFARAITTAVEAIAQNLD